MTVLWLIVWLINDTPDLSMWNNWAVALCVCLAIDALASSR